MKYRLLAAILSIVPFTTAQAADEEIQVYMDEMNPIGGYGLDLHLNYVPDGRGRNLDYAGQASSQGRFRITPEFSYGLTSEIELGAYLPLMEINSSGSFETGESQRQDQIRRTA